MTLIDPSIMNERYTWSNMRVSPIACRLDQFLYSSEWAMAFPGSRQPFGARLTSDHFPLVLETRVVPCGPSLFKFENV
ncbi:hypothetical protein Scep_029398 [Stephania cephalantha]|uniref:Endonuclease/exonuclease/phosphatase n=1 Tax=Stephania cephalantha TaxID=152367 RepID=A0AAP0E158_9MAGN